MELGLEHIAVGREPANGVFFDNCLVINYYATSECGCMVTAFQISHLYEKDIPIGKPQFDLRYRVEPLGEADGAEQGNQTGELLLYLPYFRGYIKMPEKTAEVLQDHWYRTGDIVRVREDGNLILLGRKDNRFRVKGTSVELEEVEQDAEGLQIMRILGKNMAWLVKLIENGKENGIEYPRQEETRIRTNFVR